MVLRKFALYNHCVRQIHKMLHDDLRDSENRFLEHLKLYAVVPATMRSFQVSNTSIVIEPSVTISNVLKLDRIFFLFRSFHFSFYNFKYRHSQTESEHLIGTTIIVRFRIFEIHRDSELTV